MHSRLSLAVTVLWSAILAMLVGTLTADLRAANTATEPVAVSPPAQQALTIFAGLELSPTYQPDTWQPVRLQFRNSTDRSVDGSAVLPLSHPRAPASSRCR
jgi:hypothetical protein